MVCPYRTGEQQQAADRAGWAAFWASLPPVALPDTHNIAFRVSHDTRAFCRYEYWVRGVLFRGGRRLAAYIVLPGETTDSDLIYTSARPLIAAKFAAGDYLDITMSDDCTDEIWLDARPTGVRRFQSPPLDPASFH